MFELSLGDGSPFDLVLQLGVELFELLRTLAHPIFQVDIQRSQLFAGFEQFAAFLLEKLLGSLACLALSFPAVLAQGSLSSTKKSTSVPRPADRSSRRIDTE